MSENSDVLRSALEGHAREAARLLYRVELLERFRREAQAILAEQQAELERIRLLLPNGEPTNNAMDRQ